MCISEQEQAFIKALQHYEQNASHLARNYENCSFEQLHDWVFDLLPHRSDRPVKQQTWRALDIGAGSGRDAIWLACQGYEVTAVEPCAALRREAQHYHKNTPEFKNIKWLDDKLPDLKKLSKKNYYDVIWLSAVWMHVHPSVRAMAFNRLLELMRPDALLMFSIRKPADKSRGMHEADVGEVEQLAKKNALLVAKCYQRVPDGKRKDVFWDNIALNRPSDVAEGLSTIRRIIEYDHKTTSYKLGLLRILCRVADSYPHFVERGDEKIQIPLGLVALIWYQLYHPLVAFKLPQIGGQRGLSIENEKSKAYKLIHQNKDLLKSIDLRPGGIVNFNGLEQLTDVFKEIIETIEKGPVKYTTYSFSSPANDRVQIEQPIFSICKEKVKKNKDGLNKSKKILKFQSGATASLPYSQAYLDCFNVSSQARGGLQAQGGLLNNLWLKGFGFLSLPTYLWRAFEGYSTWIEPTIIFAWQNFIKNLVQNKKQNISLVQLHAAMQWYDGVRHDTSYVKEKILDSLLSHGQSVRCVWSEKKLSLGNRATDHMMPFKLWPCNDLWNLVPAHRSINANKSAGLPSQRALNKAQDRILEWWQTAYGGTQTLRSGKRATHIADEVLHKKFIIEARMRLPLWGYAQQNPDLEDIFDGLKQIQRQIKAKTNCPEWAPSASKPTS